MDRRLEKLKDEIAIAVAGMSTEQLRAHPQRKWCAAEILEHLYLTYTGTIKACERATQANRPLVSAASWRHHARKFLVLGLQYMPAGREAPKNTRPRGLPIEKLLAEIGPKILEMDEAISQLEERFGHGLVLDHPILGSLTAAQWRKFHLVHGLHHTKQIRRLREAREAA
jgi:hypothetical protein